MKENTHSPFLSVAPEGMGESNEAMRVTKKPGNSGFIKIVCILVIFFSLIEISFEFGNIGVLADGTNDNSCSSLVEAQSMEVSGLRESVNSYLTIKCKLLKVCNDPRRNIRLSWSNSDVCITTADDNVEFIGEPVNNEGGIFTLKINNPLSMTYTPFSSENYCFFEILNITAINVNLENSLLVRDFPIQHDQWKEVRTVFTKGGTNYRNIVLAGVKSSVKAISFTVKNCNCTSENDCQAPIIMSFKANWNDSNVVFSKETNVINYLMNLDDVVSLRPGYRRLEISSGNSSKNFYFYASDLYNFRISRILHNTIIKKDDVYVKTEGDNDIVAIVTFDGTNYGEDILISNQGNIKLNYTELPEGICAVQSRDKYLFTRYSSNQFLLNGEIILTHTTKARFESRTVSLWVEHAISSISLTQGGWRNYECCDHHYIDSHGRDICEGNIECGTSLIIAVNYLGDGAPIPDNIYIYHEKTRYTGKKIRDNVYYFRYMEMTHYPVTTFFVDTTISVYPYEFTLGPDIEWNTIESYICRLNRDHDGVYYAVNNYDNITVDLIFENEYNHTNFRPGEGRALFRVCEVGPDGSVDPDCSIEKHNPNTDGYTKFAYFDVESDRRVFRTNIVTLLDLTIDTTYFIWPIQFQAEFKLLEKFTVKTRLATPKCIPWRLGKLNCITAGINYKDMNSMKFPGNNILTRDTPVIVIGPLNTSLSLLSKFVVMLTCGGHPEEEEFPLTLNSGYMDYGHDANKYKFFYQLDLSNLVKNFANNDICRISVSVVVNPTSEYVDADNAARSSNISIYSVLNPTTSVEYRRTRIDTRHLAPSGLPEMDIQFLLSNGPGIEVINSVTCGTTNIGFKRGEKNVNGVYCDFGAIVTTYIQFDCSQYVDDTCWGEIPIVAKDITVIRGLKFESVSDDDKRFLGVVITCNGIYDEVCGNIEIASVSFGENGPSTECQKNPSYNGFNCRGVIYPVSWDGLITFTISQTRYIIEKTPKEYVNILPAINKLTIDSVENNGLNPEEVAFYVGPDVPFQFDFGLSFATDSFPKEIIYETDYQDQRISGRMNGSLNSSGTSLVTVTSTIREFLPERIKNKNFDSPDYIILTIHNTYTAIDKELKFKIIISSQIPRCEHNIMFNGNTMRQCLFFSRNQNEVLEILNNATPNQDFYGHTLLDQIVYNNVKNDLVITGLSMKPEEVKKVKAVITVDDGGPLIIEEMKPECLGYFARPDGNNNDNISWSYLISLEELYPKIRVNGLYRIDVVVTSRNGRDSENLTTKLLYLSESQIVNYKKFYMIKSIDDYKNNEYKLKILLVDMPSITIIDKVVVSNESNGTTTVNSSNETISFIKILDKVLVHLSYDKVRGMQVIEANDVSRIQDIIDYKSTLYENNDTNEGSYIKIKISLNPNEGGDGTSIPTLKFTESDNIKYDCTSRAINEDPSLPYAEEKIGCKISKFPVNWRGEIWFIYHGMTIQYYFNGERMRDIFPPVDSVTLSSNIPREGDEKFGVFYVQSTSEIEITFHFNKTYSYTDALTYNYAEYELDSNYDLIDDITNIHESKQGEFLLYKTSDSKSFDSLSINVVPSISALIPNAKNGAIYVITVKNVYTYYDEADFVFMIKVTNEKPMCNNNNDGEDLCLMLIQNNEIFEDLRNWTDEMRINKDHRIYSQIYRSNTQTGSSDPIRLAVRGVNFRLCEIEKVEYDFNIFNIKQDSDGSNEAISHQAGNLTLEKLGLDTSPTPQREWVGYAELGLIMESMTPEQYGEFIVTIYTISGAESLIMRFVVKKDLDFTFIHRFSFIDKINRSKYVTVTPQMNQLVLPKYNLKLYRFICDNINPLLADILYNEKMGEEFDVLISRDDSCELNYPVMIMYGYEGLRGIWTKESDDNTEVSDFSISTRLRVDVYHEIDVNLICTVNHSSCVKDTIKIMFDEMNGRDFKELGYKIDDGATGCSINGTRIICNDVSINYNWLNSVTISTPHTLIRKSIVTSIIEPAIPYINTSFLNNIRTGKLERITLNSDINAGNLETVKVSFSSKFRFSFELSRNSEQFVKSLKLLLIFDENKENNVEVGAPVSLNQLGGNIASGDINLKSYLVGKDSLKIVICNTGTEGTSHQCETNVFAYNIIVENDGPLFEKNYCEDTDKEYSGVIFKGAGYNDGNECGSKPVFNNDSDYISFTFGPIDFNKTVLSRVEAKIETVEPIKTYKDWFVLNSEENDLTQRPLQDHNLESENLVLFDAKISIKELSLNEGVVYRIVIKCVTTSDLESEDLSDLFIIKPNLYALYNSYLIEYSDLISIGINNVKLMGYDQNSKIFKHNFVNVFCGSDPETKVDLSRAKKYSISCKSVDVLFSVRFGDVKQNVEYIGIPEIPIVGFEISETTGSMSNGELITGDTTVILSCSNSVSTGTGCSRDGIYIHFGEIASESPMEKVGPLKLYIDHIIIPYDWSGETSIVIPGKLTIKKNITKKNLRDNVPPIKSISINKWEASEERTIYLTKTTFVMEILLEQKTKSFINKVNFEVYDASNGNLVGTQQYDIKDKFLKGSNKLILDELTPQVIGIPIDSSKKYILEIKNAPTADGERGDKDVFSILVGFVTEDDRYRIYRNMNIYNLKYIDDDVSVASRMFLNDEMIQCYVSSSPEIVPIYIINATFINSNKEVVGKLKFYQNIYSEESFVAPEGSIIEVNEDGRTFMFEYKPVNKVPGNYALRLSITLADLGKDIEVELPFMILGINKVSYKHKTLEKVILDEKNIMLLGVEPIDLPNNLSADVVSAEGEYLECLYLSDENVIKLETNDINMISECHLKFSVFDKRYSTNKELYSRRLDGEIGGHPLGVLISPSETNEESCGFIDVKLLFNLTNENKNLARWPSNISYSYEKDDDSSSRIGLCEVNKYVETVRCRGIVPDIEWDGYIKFMVDDFTIKDIIDVESFKHIFPTITKVSIDGKELEIALNSLQDKMAIDLYLSQCNSGAYRTIYVAQEGQSTEEYTLTEDPSNSRHLIIKDLKLKNVNENTHYLLNIENFNNPSRLIHKYKLDIYLSSIECDMETNKFGCLSIPLEERNDINDYDTDYKLRLESAINDRTNVQIRGEFDVVGYVESVVLESKNYKETNITIKDRNINGKLEFFVNQDFLGDKNKLLILTGDKYTEITTTITLTTQYKKVFKNVIYTYSLEPELIDNEKTPLIEKKNVSGGSKVLYFKENTVEFTLRVKGIYRNTDALDIIITQREYKNGTFAQDNKVIEIYRIESGYMDKSIKLTNLKDGEYNVIVVPQNGFTKNSNLEIDYENPNVIKDLYFYISASGQKYDKNPIEIAIANENSDLCAQNYYKVHINDLVGAAGPFGTKSLEVLLDGFEGVIKEGKFAPVSTNGPNSTIINLKGVQPTTDKITVFASITDFADEKHDYDRTFKISQCKQPIELNLPKVGDSQEYIFNDDFLGEIKSWFPENDDFTYTYKLYDEFWTAIEKPKTKVENYANIDINGDIYTNGLILDKELEDNIFTSEELINAIEKEGNVFNIVVIVSDKEDENTIYENVITLRRKECTNGNDRAYFENGECKYCSIFEKSNNYTGCSFDFNTESILLLCGIGIGVIIIIVLPTTIVHWYRKNHRYNKNVKEEAKERKTLKRKLEKERDDMLMQREWEIANRKLNDENRDAIYRINQYIDSEMGYNEFGDKSNYGDYEGNSDVYSNQKIQKYFSSASNSSQIQSTTSENYSHFKPSYNPSNYFDPYNNNGSSNPTHGTSTIVSLDDGYGNDEIWESSSQQLR